MLSIQNPKIQAPEAVSTPNLLPCRVAHNGPTNVSKRHWDPRSDEEDDSRHKKVAFFRGRRLVGRAVPLHEGYRGMIARSTEKTVPQAEHDKQDQPPSLDAEDEEDEDRAADDDEPIKVMEVVGNFEEVVVWGHETLPGKDDAFVRGMEEWIGFAEAMHSTSQSSDAT